jgi:surface-adhesin protein E
MTGLLLIILLSLSCSPVFAEWVSVGGKVEGGMGAYADPATMRREGDLVKMEVLFDFKTIQTKAGVSYLSAKAQMEYDCVEQRFGGHAVMYFSGNMGSGNLVDRSSGKGKWLPVSPGSLDQALWKFACGKK